MTIQALIKKSAKTYKKLPAEFKIPFSLYLYFLLFLNNFFQNARKLLSIFRDHKKRLNLKVHQINKSIFKFIRRPFRFKKRKKISPLYTTPLVMKLKYFIFGVVFSGIFVFLPAVSVIFLQNLPHPGELTQRPIAQTTKIFDRNKILLYEIYSNQNRTIVPLKQIPNHLRLATLAIEDKNFYNHPGFDIASIVRALRENIENGQRIQGGSTITQQLVKSSLLTDEKKISRKIKEIVLAFWAERLYSKDEILEMYFNQVPYGGTAWGVEAASEVYFDKEVTKLSLAESAFLAGLTQAPSQYSPYGSTPTLWKNRQKEVLNSMVKLGYISQKQADTATKEKLNFREPQIPLRAPHFVMYIKDLLTQEYGLAAVEKGGLQVITSLDLKKQDAVQRIVREEVDKAAYLNLSNGAALITDSTNGDILAMVGSKNFNDSKDGNVNVTTSHRQPGSTVKVITYSAALMNGFTAASMLDDTLTTFPNPGSRPYTPVNYDGRYYGRVPLRFALANSLNVPAVKTINSVGVPAMVDLAKKMGIESWNNEPEYYGLSITLGGAEATMLDIATVFGTLSTRGYRVDLDPILSISDYKGTVIKEKKSVVKTKVLPEGVAYIISDILSDNVSRSVAFGPNSQLNIPGHTVAVKTGTSDSKRDNWAAGYTKDTVVTVWVGNNDGSPMSQQLASGISGATPIWHRVMSNLLEKKQDIKQKPPEDIVFKQCYGRTEYFLKGTENQAPCGRPFPSPKIYSTN